MSRKLWTSAVLLAAIAGTGALAPVGVCAQTAAPTPNPTPDLAAAIDPNAIDPALSNPAAAVDAAAVLADPNASQSQRDEAARRLLSRQTEEGRKQVHDALIEPNVGGQLAAARALEEAAQSDPSFIDPLFPLLQSRELAAAAGHALSGYKSDRGVLTRLVNLAINPRVGDWTRTAAIRALGTISEKRAASTLIDLLTSPNEPATIHSNAADALTNMTGIEENDRDPGRWMQWWTGQKNRTDADFRQTVVERKDVRLDQLTARTRTLVNEVEGLLRDQYHTTPTKDQRESLVLKLLNSSESDVRRIGALILKDAFIQEASVTDKEKQRLREMIGDSSPAVRQSVADAISTINDAGSLDALLAQLAAEPNSQVRAAIATALGPIHNLRAVKTLLKLLSDDSLPTAKAAALALSELAQHGKLAEDAALNRETAQQLGDTILKRSRTPGAEDLRSACVQALAPLKQADIVQELVNNKLLDPGKEGSWSVRRFMLMALGALNDGRFAQTISSGLTDPSPNVRLQAIQELATNPNAADYTEAIGGMMSPDREPDQSVRDAAWKFLQSVFPRLQPMQLQNWADRLKNEPEKQVLVLRALADKLSAANQQDDLAITQQSIGLAYVNQGLYGDAVAWFRAAMTHADAMPGAMRDSLVSDYMNSLLRGRKFSEAVAFAADRIRADQAQQTTMGPQIIHYVGELSGSSRREDLAAARQLLDLAKKMSPALGEKYQHQLDELDADLKKKPAP